MICKNLIVWIYELYNIYMILKYDFQIYVDIYIYVFDDNFLYLNYLKYGEMNFCFKMRGCDLRYEKKESVEVCSKLEVLGYIYRGCKLEFI